MSKEPVFQLGRYWIDKVSGSANFYKFWYDAGAGETRRRSLGTADLELAKIELAAHVIKEGSGRPVEPKDAQFIAVFNRYWEERSDKLRSKAQARCAGRYLLDFLGNDARVGAFTRKRQVEFIQTLHARGFGAGYISRLLSSVQAALNWVVAVDEDDDSGLLTRAPKIIYQPKAVAEVLNVAEPDVLRWQTSLEMIASFLDGLTPDEEFIKRWVIMQVGFCCRPEAALEATPYQLDRRHQLIHLNPQGRRQTKKHRPTIPVADALWPLLEEWSTSERLSGYTLKNYPSKQWDLARTRIGIPNEFTPRAIRHFMATELRHAHRRYGVPRVPLDEREMFMGHRRAKTNDMYGVYEPDYLDAAKTAVDAVLHALNKACKTPFLRQVSAKPIKKLEGKTRLKLMK
jgi:hypothetical protein